MKKNIIILLSIMISGCGYSINNSHKQYQGNIKNDPRINKIKSEKFKYRPCLETEGDYETKTKCIHIEKNCPPSKDDITPENCGEYLFNIIDKKTGQVIKLKGKDWTPSGAENFFSFYGVQAKDKNKLYEIDLRYPKDDIDAPIYYREWNRNKTKILIEEIAKDDPDLVED